MSAISILRAIMKTCSKCKKSKELSCFGKWKYSKDGLRNHCKACRKLEHKSYYIRNTEKINKRVAEYTKRNREEVLHRKRTYARKHKDRHKEINRRWYKENREVKLEKNKQWYVNNPNKRKVIQRRKARRRRVREMKVEENFMHDNMVYRLFKNECFVCHTRDDLTIDHHRPLCRGNALDIDNAVILCRSCNSTKGTKSPEDFYTKGQLEQLDVIFSKAKLLVGDDING